MMSDRQDELVERFREAVLSRKYIADHIASGPQFNSYESASNDDDMDDDEREYRICIGYIGDFSWLFDIEGQAKAELVVAALKIAALLAFPPSGEPT